MQLFGNIFFVCICMRIASGLNNGLALTPPMGWLAWERYRCNIDCKNYPTECISEWLFRNVTDDLVADGYAAAGYQYVIIDDCWLAETRDEDGNLQPDPDRFPSGIKALADYVHSKGLKFGIYEDYGNLTCAGYPGILGHLKQDAEKFAEWEVDYVKLDGCNSDPHDMDVGYPEFGKYLNQTGRPMVYSCSWPVYQEETGIRPNFTSIAEHCNLWRNYDDIQDSWASLTDIIDYFARRQDTITQYAGHGHWNDPDMLLVGNFGLSYEQSKVQMAVWAILAAPLLISTDLKAIRPEYREILLNREIIAVNQDQLGIQGRQIMQKSKIDVWARPVLPIQQDYYSYALAFVSYRTDGTPHRFNITLKQLGLYHPGGYLMKNLYLPEAGLNTRVMYPDSELKVDVNPTGVVFLRFNVVGDNDVEAF